MEEEYIFSDKNKKPFNLSSEFIRYFNFWPYFLISVIITVISAYTYLRYANFLFSSYAAIEIVDEAQDTEMALPTSLTVFNRSMINLENETNILKSFSLNSKVVSQLELNVEFYTKGVIKTSRNHREDWINDFSLELDDDKVSKIKKTEEYVISFQNNKSFEITKYINSEYIDVFKFKNLTTTNEGHDLPFDLTLNNVNEFSERILRIRPLRSTINEYMNSVEVKPLGLDSDQLRISLVHPNKNIAKDYINKLIDEFDIDGIEDRQLEYKSTIQFVNNRSEILRNEIEIIELEKQKFKQNNNLSDIESDASINIKEKFTYSSELFSSESQKSLATFLLNTIQENDYNYLPTNIGLENLDLNFIISDYNELIRQRERYLTGAGPNNPYLKSSEKQLSDLLNNIRNSIKNYIESLDIKIVDLKDKENEYLSIYRNIPENQKFLKSIERELQVKEALFILLLQKKEEAAINFAVVKPTIKVIDYAISGTSPVYPRKNLVYLSSIIIGLMIPFIVLFIRFEFDNKFHSKDQIDNLLINQIPVITEIPYITEKKLWESF